MALVIDSQLAGAAAGLRALGSPLTSAFVNTAGTILFAYCVATDQSGAAVVLNAPTYNSVTMTLIGSQLSTDGGLTKSGWYRLLTPATGSNTFNLTGSGNTGNFALHAELISFTGNDTTTPAGTPVSATGTSATSATGNITNTSGNYLLAGCCTGSSAPGVGATGNTLSSNKAGSTNTGGDNSAMEYFATTGSTRNMQMSQTSDIWGIIGFEVKAAAGGTETLWAQSLM